MKMSNISIIVHFLCKKSNPQHVARFMTEVDADLWPSRCSQYLSSHQEFLHPLGRRNLLNTLKLALLIGQCFLRWSTVNASRTFINVDAVWAIVWSGKALDKSIISCDPTGAEILDNPGWFRKNYTFLFSSSFRWFSLLQASVYTQRRCNNVCVIFFICVVVVVFRP